jgi:6-pyruvoyltetrahydropterin/6-carboxytetrahydropterin synthase
MYMLTIKTSFAAAHNLINYQGDCENLHGHNWKVEVSVTARELDKSGLGIAFREVSPSSEHIAKYLYERISERMNNENIKVDSITVWESDNASARYYE